MLDLIAGEGRKAHRDYDAIFASFPGMIDAGCERDIVTGFGESDFAQFVAEFDPRNKDAADQDRDGSGALVVSKCAPAFALSMLSPLYFECSLMPEAQLRRHKLADEPTAMAIVYRITRTVRGVIVHRSARIKLRMNLGQ